MSPNQVPIPLEKTVVINGSTIEISIAEKKMPEKEKKAYQKFMAKCMSESSDKTDKEAAMSCAVTFERVKAKLMIEIEEEDEEEDEEEGEEECEKEDEGEDEGDEKKEMETEKSEASSKNQGKMSYREKPKTSANSIGIITVDQINKWEKAEKNENPIAEHKETKTAWKNTIDL